MNLARKNKNLKPTRKLPQQNVDWGQKALGLWQDDKYKDPNEAVDYWNRAILNQQNTVVAFSNRGLAYHELKQYQKAVKDYSAAIKRDPGYAAAYNNRGNSYYELTEYQLALNDFNQSLKLQPQKCKGPFKPRFGFLPNGQKCPGLPGFSKLLRSGRL